MRRFAFTLLVVFLSGCGHLEEDVHFVSFAGGGRDDVVHLAVVREHVHHHLVAEEKRTAPPLEEGV